MLDSKVKENIRWTPLMSLLSDQQFDWLMESAASRAVQLGDVIKGGEEEALFVLASGRVRLIDKDNHELTICTLSNCGAMWGEAIFTGDTGPAVRASTDTSYISVSKAVLNELRQNSPAVTQLLDQESNVLRWYTLLRNTPRFKGIGYSLIKPVLLQGESKTYMEGEDLPVSKTSNGLFIVLSGAMQASRNGSVEQLLPGDWFSRGDVFPSKDSSDKNILGKVKGELLRITESSYKEIRKIQPELSSRIDGIFLANKPPGNTLVDDDTDMVISRRSSVESREQEATLLEEQTIPKLRREFKQYPIVYQHSELECGITCLQMICLFFGKNVSMSQLRDMCDIGRSGTSMLDLAEAAEQLGFFSRGVKTTYSGLQNLKPPLICYWKQNHFVVLYEINNNYAVVGDPALGIDKIDRAAFTRDFSEHALELTPTTEFGKNIEERPILNTFVPVVEPHKSLARDVVLTSLVYQILMLVTPIFTQVVLDQVIVHEDMHMLNLMLVGMLFIAVFQAAIGFIRQFLLAFLALKADQSLFSELFKRLLDLPFPFFDKHSTGDILTRFGESSSVVQFFAGQGALAVLDLLMAIVFLAIIFFYNITFGIAAFIYVIVLSVLVLCCVPYLKRLSQRAYDKQIAAESFLVEAIRGIERVKSAAAERRTRWKWELLFIDKLNVRFQELVANSTVSSLVHFIQVCGQVAFLWIGAHMVVEGKLTIGQLIAVNMLVGMIANPFIKVAELSYAFQNVSVALERLADILMEKPEEPDSANKIHITDVRGDIKFDKVTYRYSGHESANALSNVSFQSHSGEMIGIVGKTGSGKTTLLRLIQGLYLPSEGRITVDGKDLSKVALTTYRQHIGVVSQHDYYFRGTIRENISFYKPDATMEEIVRACEISGADDFVSKLPSGYESVLTEGAANFSGGQRQCMAIARAIIHNPAILIFDEATSGMDSDTELRINQCMETMRKRCTMFVVAHRLSTVKSADRIIVIDKGSIVETGNHESLINQKGLYHYLCKQQSLS